MRKVRAVILTEIIAPYRIEPFNLLFAKDSVDLDVWFCAEMERSRRWRVERERIRFRNHVLRGFSLRGGAQGFSLFVNPGVVFRLVTKRPDVVIFGGWQHPTMWFAFLTAGLTRSKRLIWSESTSRDQRSGSRLKEAMKRWFVRNADGFIVPGRSQHDHLVELGARSDQIWIAPNSVDNTHFASAAAEPLSREAARRKLSLEGTVALYVGRVTREKGIGDLVEMADQIRTTTVLIVGDGPELEGYQEECRKRAINNVIFRGFEDQSALPGYYAAADIFVFPTRSDPWGLVLNEAMAAGLPIVCSDAAGAAADLIRDEVNGLLYPAGSVAALTAAVVRVAGDPALGQMMGRQSREIISHYSPADMAAGFERAILDAI